jgi:hypothetical protein
MIAMKKLIILALAICGLSAPLSAMKLDIETKLIIGKGDTDSSRLKYTSKSEKEQNKAYTRDLNKAVDLLEKKDLAKTVKKINIISYSFESIENIASFFARFENLKSLKVIWVSATSKTTAEKLKQLSGLAEKIKRLELSGISEDEFSEGAVVTKAAKRYFGKLGDGLALK